MGALSLPTTGLVYVDTQILIYTVERHPVYEPLLRPLWQAVQVGTFAVTSSELVLLETLVQPIRNGDLALQRDYEQLLCGSELQLLLITQPILREAARLRATIPGLRTPDALHAATAILAGCHPFLTNDYRFRRIPGLAATILDEVLAS